MALTDDGPTYEAGHCSECFVNPGDKHRSWCTWKDWTANSTVPKTDEPPADPTAPLRPPQYGGYVARRRGPGGRRG